MKPDKKMEDMFDEMYRQTIPLILFSTDKDKRKYTDMLSGLFNAYSTENTLVFNEIYASLCSGLEERQKYDRHKENLIYQFKSRYFSFHERLLELESKRDRFDDLVKKMENILNNQKRHTSIINAHAQLIHGLKERVSFFEMTMQTTIEKMVEAKPTTHQTPTQDVSIYQVENLSKNKDNVGRYFLQCPRCSYKWWYKGRSNIGERVQCPRPSCRRNFIINPEHILERNKLKSGC